LLKTVKVRKDYRTAIVMDDVNNHNINELIIKEPNSEGKETIFERK